MLSLNADPVMRDLELAPGASQAGIDRSEDLHRISWHDDIAKTPHLAAPDHALTDFIFGSDEENSEVERLLAGETKHDHRGAHGGAMASYDHDRGSDLKLQRIEAVIRPLAHPAQAAIGVPEGGSTCNAATLFSRTQAGVHPHGVCALCRQRKYSIAPTSDDDGWGERQGEDVIERPDHT